MVDMDDAHKTFINSLDVEVGLSRKEGIWITLGLTL